MAKLYKNFGGGTPSPLKSRFLNTLVAVRVKDVILDDTHPEYRKLGESNSIGAIKYALLDRDINTENTADLYVAYPISSTIRTLPLKNEIVFIIQAPNMDISNIKGTSMYTYYTTIVSLWNHPTHNKAPKDYGDRDLQDNSGFPDIDNVNPLQPFPGDVLVEGRLGQSIRLGGSLFNKNTLTDGSNNGEPFTLISNGQKEVGNGIQPITEDINKDASSIYLVSNHTIPIIQSRTKVESISRKPNFAQNYKGSQVIINKKII
jgi:hypothetical protein